LEETTQYNTQLESENARLKVHAKQIEKHLAREQQQRDVQDKDRFEISQKKIGEQEREIMSLKKELETLRKTVSVHHEHRQGPITADKKLPDQTSSMLATPRKTLSISSTTSPPDVKDILESYSALTQLDTNQDDEYL
jgi:wobble nucleotide-excising tRNase